VGTNATGTTYGADQMFNTYCPPPGPAGAITGPASICKPSQGNVYTVPPIADATSYVWTLPTGATITAGQNTNSITVSYDVTAISGNITVYGSSNCGVGTASSLPVTVNPIPVPTITGNDPACLGNTADYATQTGMSNYVWTVSSGGQIIAGAGTAGITVQWNSTGNQTVSVIYASPAGCPATVPGTLGVTVGNEPLPTIAGSNMLCPNSGFHVYTTEPGFSSYVWGVSSGGTIISGQGTNQVEINWTASGTQTVSVNYENTQGCSANNPKTFGVTVLSLPAAAGAVSGPDEVCTGFFEDYQVNPIPDALTYIWTLPEGASILDGEGTPEITVWFGPSAVSGDITVYGVNNCGTGATSPAFEVDVYPRPSAPVVTVDLDYLLTSNAPDGNQWYFEGNAIDGATGQTYQAEEEGMYWTVVTLNGCTSDPSNQVEVVFVGMDELPGTSLSIYPIPNKGQFTIAVVNQAEKTYNVQVLNHLGARVYEKTNLVINGKGQLDVDLGNVSEGVYTVSIRMDNSRVMRKIIVTK
jgi:hypothetical protein